MSHGRSSYVNALMEEVEERTGKDLKSKEVDMAIEQGECYSVDDLLDMLRSTSNSDS